eukprot:GHVR01057208.1.p1 GENE.GHVR01057208.1~~GHVR01057208.1.p1  ORF type:complete len:151 (+),score=29.30 GHVR01057208.1:74-526(+)
MSSLDSKTLIKIKDVQDKWSDPEYSEDISCIDWRSPTLRKLREGDTEGMRAAALPAVQMKILEIANEGATEQLQLQASMFVMAQAGQGQVQKVSHDMNFEQMPAEQLVSIINSKLNNIKRINPEFSLDKLLEAPAISIEAELLEVTPEGE